MEREFLAERPDAGESIEAIAREVGKHPSTVAYWANKHGLRSRHAARHASRGPLARSDLQRLIDEGMGVRQIAQALDRSTATVRHWLGRYELKTAAAERMRRDRSTAPEVIRDCPRHGWTRFQRLGAQTHYRCAQCITQAVTERRRRIKAILVAEAGGECAICGYARANAALQFHHIDPATKAFEIRAAGSRALGRIRDEAAKCVLLCANCHAEVESGRAQVPVPSDLCAPSGVAQSDDPG
jgi:hypothetical protein